MFLSISRPVAAIGALLGFLYSGLLLAQVPIPLQEQVQLFNTLPESQQQALLRELQAQLSPAQREILIGALRQGAGPTNVGSQASTEQSESGPNEPAQAGVDESVVRLGAGDTVVIDLSITGDELDEALVAFETRLEDMNPYRLDEDGALLLPGVPEIPIAGLNIRQATVRIGAEPRLRDFDVHIEYLPLSPVGTASLSRYGDELFRGAPSDFAAVSDVPVPADYVIGPGDTVNILLFGGDQSAEYFLQVNRDGTISFPRIGPLSVSGLTFTEMRALIDERVEAQLPGTRASTTLGELRGIQVYVSGDVEKPGLYTVSGLSTMTNALFASGGIKPIGSLRRIELRRDDETVSSYDLYDFLLRGDRSGDSRLQPGDVIFVPPVGQTVALRGEIRRPAIYELNGETTVGEVIAMGGGLTPRANRASVKIERLVPGRGTAVSDLDLGLTDDAESDVQDGDVIRVLKNLEQLENTVRLAGNVYEPGLYEWYSGMRMTDVLPGPEYVMPRTDLNYVLVEREERPNVDISILSASLQSAWLEPGSAANIELQARDIVYVFNFDTGRRHIVEPILETLEAQADSNEAMPIVRVGGRVRSDGQYPLESGMRVSDLLRAGGGLSEAAYLVEAELTRYAVRGGEYRETELITVDLDGILRGDPGADLSLTPHDHLNIKELPEWNETQSVTIVGEVAFPGEFTIVRGETLTSVLERAGGLTEYAFPQGSVFTRADVRESQQETLDNLASRLEADLASMSLTDPGAENALTTGRSLLEQIDESDAVGRLVIDLAAIVAGRSGTDIVLQDGDRLYIPQERQEVSVLGEIQYATSHIYEEGLSVEDYVSRSGGYTQRSDKRRTYIVRANGMVVSEIDRGRWFRRDAYSDVRPGDTIVVPLDLDRPLSRWSAITQIIYNLAIAAAAVNSF